ncbi:hypothetical protein Q787_00920 [Ornithobacterium rhinotracheale H06-030791]|nr:hypothetical protein Q785_00955 [Ornithobacterium rhinotracheale ORT-UMN 88]KGB67793.1 hypothetical protein Q787_00920 [Ornithobacterium rhinotracheale H06-030791]
MINANTFTQFTEISIFYRASFYLKNYNIKISKLHIIKNFETCKGKKCFFKNNKKHKPHKNQILWGL